MQGIFQKVFQGIPHWFGTPDGFRSPRISQDMQESLGIPTTLEDFQNPPFLRRLRVSSIILCPLSDSACLEASEGCERAFWTSCRLLIVSSGEIFNRF